MRYLIILLIILALAVPAATQGNTDYDVWTTTQRELNLREGPSTEFDIITTLDWGVTLPVIGRTLQGNWLQVIWEDEQGQPVRGWLSARYLRWTGDILRLPVDGIEPEPFARESGPLITIYPDTFYYRNSISAANQVINTVSEPTEVELTGRIGSARNGEFWVQFRLNGEYYWTGSWAVALPGSYIETVSGSYLYAYGRLVDQLRAEINDTNRTYDRITSNWQALAQDGTASCRFIPTPAQIDEETLRPVDIQQAPAFVPAITALENAITDINTAIRQFNDICANLLEPVTEDQINTALSHLSDARRQLTLAETLLIPLRLEDPLIGGGA
jgi:uncharacterized protein YraI